MQSIGRASRVSSLALAVAISGFSTLSAQSITPKFAWPANSVAEISIRTTTIQESRGKRDSIEQVAQSRLQGRAHSAGTLIISGPTTGLSNPSTQAAPSVAALMKFVSRYIVGADGMFARLEDVQATKQAMDSAMAPMTQRLRTMTTPGAAESLEKMTSPERLTENVERQWQMISGMLFGRRWAPGDTTLRRSTMPIPNFPGADVLTTITARYIGVAPCPANSNAKVCWQFESTMDMDMNSLRAAMVEMLRSMGLDDPAAVANAPIPRTTTQSTIIFDAATSRPLISTARMAMEMKGELAGNAVSNSARSTAVATYSWKP